MLNSNPEKKFCYSIRKYSIGVVSVAVTACFLAGPKALAAEVKPATSTPTATQEKDKKGEDKGQAAPQIQPVTGVGGNVSPSPAKPSENKKALNKQVRTNEKESGKEKKEAQTPEKKETKKETQNEEASALHAKMMLLSGSIHDKAETLESVDYKKANQIRQKPYDEAVQKAENILDMEKGENKTAEEVEQLKQEIETTKKALDGQERLDLAKTESSKQLKNYTYLTQGQVDSVKNFIEKEAKMNKEIEVRMGAAASLNTEMSNLQHIVEENKDLQSKANYTESDDDRKKAYNTAYGNAEKIIKKDSTDDKDETAVNEAQRAVLKARLELKGDERLSHARKEVDTVIESAQHLNDQQKKVLQDMAKSKHMVAEF